jgi:hypothetical protein
VTVRELSGHGEADSGKLDLDLDDDLDSNIDIDGNVVV